MNSVIPTWPASHLRDTCQMIHHENYISEEKLPQRWSEIWVDIKDNWVKTCRIKLGLQLEIT